MIHETNEINKHFEVVAAAAAAQCGLVCAVMIQTCLFSQSQPTWIWMKRKQPVSTWSMLIKKKNSTALPQRVWSGAIIKQKRNIFTFQICCISKAPLSVARASYGFARQRISQGEMTPVTNVCLGICSAWKPIITGNMSVSEEHNSQLKSDLLFRTGLCCTWQIFCIAYQTFNCGMCATLSWDERLARNYHSIKVKAIYESLSKGHGVNTHAHTCTHSIQSAETYIMPQQTSKFCFGFNTHSPPIALSLLWAQ